MAGTGGINFSRPAVEIWWEPGADVPAEAPVTITATNAENGDVGIVHDSNDGFHVLTYPAGFQGSDHITIEDENGTLVAEFDISVKVAG